MKIAFFGTKEYDRKYFENNKEHEIEFFKPRLSSQTAIMANGYDGVCVFVNDDLSDETLKILKENEIKYILLRCAGYNNVDIEKAKEYGIVVVRVPSYSPEAVAEHAEGFQGKGVVFCGDLNDTPISYAHRMMSEGMKDAYTESGNGPGFSYNQHRMFFRIDHILLSKNLKAYYCTVDNSIDASDHYPIWCYISWE